MRAEILEAPQDRRARAFASSFAGTRRDLELVTTESATRMRGLIDELRDEISERLEAALPSDPRAPFGTRVLPSIGSSIQRAVNNWKRLSGRELELGLDGALDLGGASTATALNAAGVSVVAPAVSPDLLNVLARPTRSVLDEMGRGLEQKIEQQVRFSAAGLNSASEAQRNIEGLLKTSTEVRRGARRRIGFTYQSEAITRTEMGRAFGTAQSNANLELAKSVPGLKKRWVTVGGVRVRRGHREAEARYSEGADPGPIPVDQRYRVTDYSRTGRSEFATFLARGGQRVARVTPYLRRGSISRQSLLYPLDPAAGAGFVVNCRCVSMEVVPDFEAALNKSLGIVQEALRESTWCAGSC